MSDKMTRHERLAYERWWCAYELNWIKEGGTSEYSAEYLAGFIAAVDLIEGEGE